MASEKVTQMIEKKLWTNVLLGTWSNSDVSVNIEKETVFENLFTEVNCHGYTTNELKLNVSDENIPSVSTEKTEKVSWMKNDEGYCSTLGFSPSSELNNERKHDEGKSFDETNDKIDYFDSDEEYMETHGQRHEDEVVFDSTEESNTVLKGRYSEGVEQYKNVPFYRRSIRIFARANNFEIYDVISDGNCMFRAIADQFMINGRIGYTAERLRCTAIDYLRRHPYKEDSQHTRSFLCAESWEEYLSRMSKSSEWSDHIVLQAVADAHNLDVVVFNVFQDDIRRTEVHSESKNGKQMPIFLGHLGEFHYLSLRPDHWTSLWPYKSLLFRILTCSHNLTPKAKQELVHNKIKEMGANEIVSEDEYLQMLQLHVGEGSKNINVLKKTSECPEISKEIHRDNYLLEIDSYCLDDLQLEETEESLSRIFFDPMYIDVITGIPLPHLSHILKQLFPLNMLVKYIRVCPPLVLPDICVHYMGSFVDGIDVFLMDISKSQTKRIFYNTHRQKLVGDVVVIPRDKIVRHSHAAEGLPSMHAAYIYADPSKSHPGYCQLRLPRNTPGVFETNQKESEMFLKEIEIHADVTLPKNVNVKYKGLMCETFPPSAQEWRVRERHFTFPSSRLIHSILNLKCTLIKKAHPRSEEPDKEWKYNFSMAEQIIFTTGISESQYHGFCVFKVLVENATFHLTKQLKNKHLKAVYLNALEKIPCEAWESNFSGCILFVISALITCLNAKFLPHYFIPTNNIIDCFSVAEIEAICVNVECIRLFPLAVIQNIAESHGYHYAPKLMKMVFNNCKSFVHNKDLASVFMSAFTPGTVCAAKVLTRLGFYEAAFQLLRYVHEQMLLLPMADDFYDVPSFLEFFDIAVKSLRQRSSRVILAKIFQKQFQIDVVNEYIVSNGIYAKDVLPWKVDFRIGWTEIPKEKTADFVALADMYYSYSLIEYDKRNSTLSTLALETAILCINKAFDMDTISLDEIEEETLKKEIMTEKDHVVRNLRKKLKVYYTQMLAISNLYRSFKPLKDHMDDIEKLCDELPEMADTVSTMFKYLDREEKALEYERKSKTGFKLETAYLKYDF